MPTVGLPELLCLVITSFLVALPTLDTKCHLRGCLRTLYWLVAGSTGLIVNYGPKLNTGGKGREVVVRGPQKYRAKHMKSGRPNSGE